VEISALNDEEYAAYTQSQFDKIYPKLVELYPEPRSGLDFENPYQLLIATILSAQSTDVQVNKITPALFKRFPTPEILAVSTVEEIEQYVRSTGFYHNKAKSLLGTGRLLVEKYGGVVPASMQDLIKMPGAARKTANVVLGNAFGINVGIPVDTHVTRLSQRLGLSKYITPEKIEVDLMRESPQEQWALVSHRLIWHGRKVCIARKPLCHQCTLALDCPTGRGILMLETKIP